jgi:hypothetical protein
MSSPLARFAPSRKFLLLACAALAGTALSAVVAWQWPLAWIAVGLFVLTAAALFVLFGQPVIEIYDTHLQVGRRAILWTDIRRVDQRIARRPTCRWVS